MNEADRRPVTVLFADLSGFTSLSERLDPEDVRAIQTDLFEGLSGAVLEYGGFVEKFAGDAVMAVFGAPVAHEDDSQRALHAALAMQDGAGTLSSRWEDRLGQPLLLHIGVKSRIRIGTAPLCAAFKARETPLHRQPGRLEGTRNFRFSPLQ